MYCNKNNLSAELSITHKVRPVQRVKLIMDIMAVFHIKTWIVRRYSYIYNIHHSAWAAWSQSHTAVFSQRISRDILLKNLETDDDFLCGNVERWNDRFFDCCIFLSSSRSLEANIASVCFLRLQYRVLKTYGHTKFSSTFLTIKEFQVFLFWHNDPK